MATSKTGNLSLFFRSLRIRNMWKIKSFSKTNRNLGILQLDMQSRTLKKFHINRKKERNGVTDLGPIYSV